MGLMDDCMLALIVKWAADCVVSHLPVLFVAYPFLVYHLYTAKSW